MTAKHSAMAAGNSGKLFLGFLVPLPKIKYVDVCRWSESMRVLSSVLLSEWIPLPSWQKQLELWLFECVSMNTYLCTYYLGLLPLCVLWLVENTSSCHNCRRILGSCRRSSLSFFPKTGGSDIVGSSIDTTLSSCHPPLSIPAQSWKPRKFRWSNILLEVCSFFSSVGLQFQLETRERKLDSTISVTKAVSEVCPHDSDMSQTTTAALKVSGKLC